MNQMKGQTTAKKMMASTKLTHQTTGNGLRCELVHGNKLRRTLTGLMIASLLVLTSCAVPPPPISEGHINKAEQKPKGAVPPPVRQTPVVPKPKASPVDEVYTIVVSDVPVRELLFALAREAKTNIDIHPGIKGSVTMNAIDQTLQQILDRLARQVDLRYETKGPNLVISPDVPYLQTYAIDYANIARDVSGTVSLSTQIASGRGTSGGAGGGSGGSGSGRGARGNNSTTRVISTSNNQFWKTLVSNVRAILGERSAQSQSGSSSSSSSVIASPETGLLTVLATSKQHIDIQKLIDKIIASAHRQVLIEATIVEVTLSQEYQTGVDWSRLQKLAGEGLIFQQSLGSFTGGVTPVFTIGANFPNDTLGNITATVNLLEAFGDLTVLSSPKVMVLNNQTAVMKVVNNRVYFTIEVNQTTNQTNTVTTFESTVHTVPEGLVLTVTPQISDSDNITLNVRPTITEIRNFVRDPAVDIAVAQAQAAGQGKVIIPSITSEVPIVTVREIDSMLRVGSGQTAVLGGLIKDRRRKNREGLPGLSRIETIGDAFSHRAEEFEKVELVIFLRPTVIRNPDISADLANFRQYLPSIKDTQHPLKPAQGNTP